MEEKRFLKDTGELRRARGRESPIVIVYAKAVGNVAEEKKYTLLHGW